MFPSKYQSYILQDICVLLHLYILFWGIICCISKEKAFASNSRPQLTIQCKRGRKRKKERSEWCLRLSRADKQQLHITHLDSKRTEIALKAPTLTL